MWGPWGVHAKERELNLLRASKTEAILDIPRGT